MIHFLFTHTSTSKKYQSRLIDRIINATPIKEREDNIFPCTRFVAASDKTKKTRARNRTRKRQFSRNFHARKKLFPRNLSPTPPPVDSFLITRRFYRGQHPTTSSPRADTDSDT